MISIIIPTYNEEKAIGGLLGSFSYNGDYEVIIADGGSDDRTVEKASAYPVETVRCDRGRALQMNRGAEAARGDVLLFLHADCTLEEGSIQEIKKAVAGGAVGGAFRQTIPSGRPWYRSIEASGNLRARVSGVYYGDQAIFVRRDVFRRIGGFDEVELFEDVIFSRKLAKAGRVALLDKRVYASPRRWESQGLVKATAINWLVSLGFMLGVSPATLRRFYRDIR